MDKKSIVNDLYQAVVIIIFAVGYSVLGKKILKIAPASIQKFNLEDTGKTGYYRCCIRDDERISHQTEDSTRTHQHLKNGKHSNVNRRSFGKCPSFSLEVPICFRDYPRIALMLR